MKKATTEIKTPLNPLLVNPLAEFEPLQQVPLIERIGIDRSIVFNFKLLSLDTDHLSTLISKKNKNQYIVVVEDEKSPIELPNGKRIGKLIIQDQFVGKLTIELRKNNLKNSSYINSTLAISVSGENQNNLQNLNADGYRKRIEDIFEHLKDTYKLEINHSSLEVKQLELNTTFFLDERFWKYKYPILMMMRNLPPKRYGKDKNNDSVKFATWYESNMQKQKVNLETALAKNNGNTVDFKCYNKGKHLQDIGEMGELEQDIMRIEYTIRDKEILRAAFGSNSIKNITDENINKLFKKNFNKDVVNRFYEWHKRNHEELLELVTKHRAMNEKWTSGFFRECRQYAEVNGLPVLFDLEDVKSVIKELEPKSNKDPNGNAKNKYRRFLKQAVYEMDLLGNTRRMKEILKKVSDM